LRLRFGFADHCARLEIIFTYLLTCKWRYSIFLTVGEVKRTILHSVPSSKDQSNRCGDFAIFVIFQDGGRRHRHLVFSKIQIFNGACAAWGQYSSLCHILSESVERWQRYGYLTGFF